MPGHLKDGACEVSGGVEMTATSSLLAKVARLLDHDARAQGGGALTTADGP